MQKYINFYELPFSRPIDNIELFEDQTEMTVHWRSNQLAPTMYIVSNIEITQDAVYGMYQIGVRVYPFMIWDEED